MSMKLSPNDAKWVKEAREEFIKLVEGKKAMTEASPTFAKFNPTSNPDVTAIKEQTDALIDLVKRVGKDQRRVALAATNYEQAAMWAVKSLFTGEDT